MILQNDADADPDTKIAAENGKLLKAKQLFAHCIRFLKEEALEGIRERTGDEVYGAEEIQWVLTVPAIWTLKARQFMREAAYEAGLGSCNSPEQLLIAVESEAAALYYTDAEDLERLRGAHYIVVNIGGGTFDVTVHEKQDDATINVLYKGTGDPMGALK
ncbi:heat shock 70 kDa protein 12A-like [Stylophora pistillata]|uniref:heat shock 70 kDa protein 12A-like n=1 Tax=Stylophora pistillata TaxID=50429 RepID=UPI000C041159|nr:heat shock 70 kDa protein 12A-like [Stylophora pistillata]